MPTCTQADNLHQDSRKVEPIRDISASAHKQPLQHGEKRQQMGTNQKETIQQAKGGYFTSNLPQTKS